MPVKQLFISVLSGKNGNSLTKLQLDFYPLFVNKIYPRCWVFIKNRYGWINEWEEIVEEVVKNTFEEYFFYPLKKLAKFKYGKSWDDETFKNKLLAWFTRITFNKLIDHFIELDENNTQLERYKYYCQLGLDKEETGDPNNFHIVERQILASALNQLTPRQREILIIYFENDCYIDSNKKLPREIMRKLCKKYKITSAYVRKIKIQSWVIVKNLCFPHLGSFKN